MARKWTAKGFEVSPDGVYALTQSKFGDSLPACPYERFPETEATCWGKAHERFPETDAPRRGTAHEQHALAAYEAYKADKRDVGCFIVRGQKKVLRASSPRAPRRVLQPPAHGAGAVLVEQNAKDISSGPCSQTRMVHDSIKDSVNENKRESRLLLDAPVEPEVLQHTLPCKGMNAEGPPDVHADVHF